MPRAARVKSNSALDYIRFGKKSGYKMYGYFRFTSLPNLPAGGNITGGKITFTFRNGQNTPTSSSGIKMKSKMISSAQWQESTITWNNKPSGTTEKTSTLIYNGSYLNYFDVNVGDEVRNWYSGVSANYGISFTYSNEDYNDYNSVVSCEGDADRSPKITISYELTGLSTGRDYYIRNAKSGLYLTVPNGSSTSGTDLVQSPFVGTNAQKFKLVFIARTGDYWLYPLCAASDCCVEVTSGSNANNAVIQIGTDTSSTPPIRQRFRVQQNDDGSFSFLSRVSNYSKAIVVYNASTSDGAAIIQYTANGTANSKWYIEPVIDVDSVRNVYTNSNANVNNNFNRVSAASYADTYAEYANFYYEYYNNADCTNFVSQCLRAGGVMFDVDTDDYAFVNARSFYQHWCGYDNTDHAGMQAYQIVSYDSFADALDDVEFLVSYLKKGDVIQLKYSNGNAYHTMIVYDDDEECDGRHRGNANCYSNEGKKEILYAQHTDDYKNGHLRYILEKKKSDDESIVFIKIKKD